VYITFFATLASMNTIFDHGLQPSSSDSLPLMARLPQQT